MLHWERNSVNNVHRLCILRSRIQRYFTNFYSFLYFSLGAGVIKLVSFLLLSLIDSGHGAVLVLAEIVSVVLSGLFNFTWNRKFTFRSTNNIVPGMFLYGLYSLIATPAVASFIVDLTRRGWADWLAKAMKMALHFILDSLYCKFVIFRQVKERASVRKKGFDTKPFF